MDSRNRGFLKQIIRSSFIRSVFIVATGTAGAQAITMAFAPIVTRLYGPEAFGLLGTFTAVLAVVTPVAALTYPIAIVLPKRDHDAIGLAKLSLMVALGTSTVALVVVWLWGETLAAMAGILAVAQYLWLIPLAMLFSVVLQVMEQWLIRHRRFTLTAKAALLRSAVINALKAGIGTIHPTAAVLIVLQAVGAGLHACFLWLGIRKQLRPEEKESGPSPTLRLLAHQHRDFPIFRAPEVTIYAVSESLPVLMLAALFGTAAAGFYTLSRTVMGVPSALIGKSVGDVFYPRISQAAHDGIPLYPLVKKATLLLAIAGLIPFAIVMLAGPDLFSFVFGAEWRTAGEYARWLALWMFFLFINNPSVKAVPVLKIQGFHLAYTTLILLAWSGALFLAYLLFEDELLSVVFFSVAGAILNIGLIVIIMNKCRLRDRDVLGKRVSSVNNDMRIS